LIINRDPRTGFIEVADSTQHKKVEKLLDVCYGVDSDLVNCNVNDIRAEINKRRRQKLARESVNKLQENNVVWNENRAVLERELLAKDMIGYFSKLDKRKNMKIRVEKHMKFRDESFKRFLNY
jgi:ribosome-associated protein YbcJ (S4-like RNA binding protein)